LVAERRAGQLLKGMDKARAGRPSKNPSTESRDFQQPLADLGISYNQSSQWQKLADVDSETFEQAVKQDRPTTSGIIEQAAPPREPKKNAVGAPPCGFGAGCSTRRLHWRLTLASAKTWKSMFG